MMPGTIAWDSANFFVSYGTMARAMGDIGMERDGTTVGTDDGVGGSCRTIRELDCGYCTVLYTDEL